MDHEELNDYLVKSSESSVKSLQSNHSKPPPPPPPSKAPKSLQELLLSRNNNNTRVVSPLSSGGKDAEASNTPSQDAILRSNTNPPPPLTSSSVNLAVTEDDESLWNPPLSSTTITAASIPSSTPSTLQLKPVPASSYLMDEYEEREQQELEMPSQSYQVLPDETDLMAILGGHLHPQSQPVDIPQSITASQLSSHSSYQQTQQQHLLQQPSVTTSNDDVIELYSTIAMLKKENNELMRDLEATKKSKEVQVSELSNKLQSAVEDSRSLPQLKKELASANEMIQRLHEDLHVLETHREQQQFELHEKDELLSSIQSTKASDLQSLRNENNTMKMEINKLRMENSMNKANQEKIQNECVELKKEISFLTSEQEKMITIHNQEISNLQNDKRKVDDQCQMMRNELNDKVSLIHQVANDMTRLENTVNNLTMENNQLKQRVFSYELMERDLNNIKFHAGQLEQNNNQLQREVASLRQQIQSLQNAAASMPPSSMESLSSAGYNSNNYSYSSYGGAATSSSAVPSAASSTMSAGPSYSPRPIMSSHSYSSLPTERPSAAMPMTGSQKTAPRSLSSALGHDFPDRSMPSPSSAMAGQGGGGSSGPSSLSAALGGRKNVGNASFGGGAPGGNNSSSLASLLTNHGLPPQQVQGSGSAKHVRSSPFATEETAATLMSQFEILERDLTGLMSEKTMLQDEAEKLQVRGLKTVRDRSRLQQVERRLEELSKDISSLRLKLTSKPG